MKTKEINDVQRILKQRCESTPCREIHFEGRAWIKQYWTLREGVEGHQLHTVVSQYSEHNNVHYMKSNGGGYCKQAESYWDALRVLGIMTKEDVDSTPDGGSVDYKYFVGGNYYHVPNEEILEYKS